MSLSWFRQEPGNHFGAMLLIRWLLGFGSSGKATGPADSIGVGGLMGGEQRLERHLH